MNSQRRPFPEWIYGQSAALPFRWRGEELEVLLITTRGGKRWIVPKGIVEPGLSPQASAANEALEEAGVRGDIADAALGSYRRSKWGGTCEVDVHPLRVSDELQDWEESGFRQRRWLPVPDALRHVEEPGLRSVIARLPDVTPAPGSFLGRMRTPRRQARLIYLLRHADSNPASHPADDFDRPLTPDGVAACHRMHRYLGMADVHPALVLCSTARRARQTLDAIMPALDGVPVVRYLEEIFLEGSDALAQRLRHTDPDVRKVMLVGHNPAVRSLAVHLESGRSAAGAAPRENRFPPGALAIFILQKASWQDLDAGSCELHSLVAPSDVQSST
jgi:phosphohistidine phosphatase SixA/8-oxo-dGTP pyrophosphatase MutT (NUDIX family)